MKRKKIHFTIFVFILIAVSCKKENKETPSGSFNGYVIDQETGDSLSSVLLKFHFSKIVDGCIFLCHDEVVLDKSLLSTDNGSYSISYPSFDGTGVEVFCEALYVLCSNDNAYTTYRHGYFMGRLRLPLHSDLDKNIYIESEIGSMRTEYINSMFGDSLSQESYSNCID